VLFAYPNDFVVIGNAIQKRDFMVEVIEPFLSKSEAFASNRMISDGHSFLRNNFTVENFFNQHAATLLNVKIK